MADCSKTEVFFEELKRMCNKFNSTCVGCKIYGICFDTGCYSFIKNDTQQAIEIVQKWSDENPPKTHQTMLLEMFPSAIILGGVIDLCPKWLDEKIGCNYPQTGCFKCKEKYWLAEVE